MIRLRVPSIMRVLWAALREWWDAWLPLLLINLIAAPCVLLIILAPPALFGIYASANSLAYGRTPSIADFIAAMRRYFAKSWQWAIPNGVIGFLAWSSSRFYHQLNTQIGGVLKLLVLFVVIIWSMIQFYALPYLIEQDNKNLVQSWRNGLYTLLASPFYTLIVMLISALILSTTIVLLLLLFLGGPCFFALFATRIVFERLETFGIRVHSD